MRPPRRIVKLSLSRRNSTGRAIARLRHDARPRITQEDLAARLARQGLPFNQSQIAKIESGRRPVTDFELTAIARALKVPIAALFE
ncbi:MAG: helix-turn-helix transcriptional regulator [Opitutaceae bacterium]|nr:helix-turn-helix transcriptional regulator [Opitutaceae bacterium]